MSYALTIMRSSRLYVLVLCACSADRFVAATSNDGGADAPDASPSDANFCAKVMPAPQFCMDFDNGSKTLALINGTVASIAPLPNETGGGVAQLVMGSTSPWSLVTTTPATILATSRTAVAYAPISLVNNPLGDYRMIAGVYVPAYKTTSGPSQETRLMGFGLAKTGMSGTAQRQVAIWVSARANGKLALALAQVDGVNPTDYQSQEFANPPAGAFLTLDVHLQSSKLCELRVTDKNGETVAATLNANAIFGEADTSNAFFGQVVYPPMSAIVAGFDDVLIP